ncbi:hypothetical protein BCV72DRAFT_57045 [Rhizopus microsporus var. microsporus]|uniref:Uncharacterized protein n=1 Tax=Rhizopus microsporus var. microsporus TaxID=86635 RepID=A0A1X0QR21_RHIZD|nr:hypothetical protein BCV72DRAFT_57045 [Rhizopus microsporus var. microsporus]
MTFDRTREEEEPSSMLFNNDLWAPQPMTDYSSTSIQLDMPLPAVSSNNNNNNSNNNSNNSALPRPAVNTTNPSTAPPPPMLDPTKIYHPEWGVIKDQDFHPLTLKHQRDLEVLFQSGSAISDFYFWQANLGGYCMADMIQGVVVSTEGAFVLERKIVEGAPHPGRRKKKRGLG